MVTFRYIVHAGPFVEVGGVQEKADGSLRAAPWPKTCLAQAMVVIWVEASVQTPRLEAPGSARKPIAMKADPRRMPSRGKDVGHWWDDDTIYLSVQ